LTYPSPAPTDTPRPAATIPRTAAPAETCWSHSGRLVKGVIDTELLDKPMTYTVYQPPCYAEKTALRYPVLYLLHGQDSHEDQWLRLGVPATADRLIAAGEMPPFIIVFPYDYSHQQPDDYGFEAVFLQLLIPRIDLTYRTLTDPAHRAVGGLSRGGAWALHLGLHHPEVFGVIGAHSPAIFYADYNSLPLIVNAIPPEKLPRISIDIGDGDGGLGSVETFTNFLNVHNIPHEWQEHIGFHEEKYWAAHVEEYLRWYAQTW
jgi:enterochelin esterase-like enzyme